jgi:hypothetical protein
LKEKNKKITTFIKNQELTMDATTTAAITAGIAYIGKICNPAADELSLLLKDQVSGWRANNAIKIANKAQLLLEKQVGNLVVSAHPRIIYSTIEHGSWTEDDLMQNFWAGLLASSCTPDGKDESNLIFINILSKITTSQAKLIEYICTTITPYKLPGGWIGASTLNLECDELQKITGINDVHQLDIELDHLRSLDLIQGGFNPHSTYADITPNALCLQLYVRSQGYVGSPIDYFDAKEINVTNIDLA